MAKFVSIAGLILTAIGVAISYLSLDENKEHTSASQTSSGYCSPNISSSTSVYVNCNSPTINRGDIGEYRGGVNTSWVMKDKSDKDNYAFVDFLSRNASKLVYIDLSMDVSNLIGIKPIINTTEDCPFDMSSIIDRRISGIVIPIPLNEYVDKYKFTKKFYCENSFVFSSSDEHVEVSYAGPGIWFVHLAGFYFVTRDFGGGPSTIFKLSEEKMPLDVRTKFNQ